MQAINLEVIIMNQEVQNSDVVPDNDVKTWAMICHLSALAGYFIPLGHIFGPLIVWAIKKDEYAFVDTQGKEAINFQLSMTIAYLISIVLCLVFIGFLLLGILAVYGLVMMIIAAIKTNDGIDFRYPRVIRFLK
jgi:uncharacterized Tic20 family protein